MTEEPDYAKEQAKAQYESICEMVAALDVDYDRLTGLTEIKDSLLRAIQYASTEDELKEAEDDFQEWEGRHGFDLEGLEQAAGECESREDAEQHIQEAPLSVLVRSDWYAPGTDDRDSGPVEFEIILCTGGPAVRIIGELNEYGVPIHAHIEHQDWGTGWTPFYGAEEATLLAYCSNFYFGE